MKRMKSLTILAIFILSLFLIYGCGENAGDGSTGSTGTTTGSDSLTLSVTSNVVSFGTPVTATATLRDVNGALVPNAVITFAATSDLVTFIPTSATALTNTSGVASVSLNAASIDSTGATSITASTELTSGGTTSTVTSTPVGIAVNGAAVTIQSLTLSQPSISAYGSSGVNAVVWINGATATVPISVAFTSACVGSGKATLTTPVTTIAGTATSTYKDNACASGTDTITASVTGATASATITVAIPATNNMQFVSATPSIIGTQTAGAATLPKSSLVKFKVVDINNNGKAGVLVDFSLVPTNAPGGITFSPASATSDANGEVTTSVTSGTVPTPLWVVAKVHATPSILSQSNTLTITTGLPTQNFFSLSNQTDNIEGWAYDGITSALTIIASDRLGNPIPDGTAINFITEGGQIVPASCTTTSGTCSVTFKSAALRPANGRVTILAYALGEESFVDSNGNNSYDLGETFYNLGDPFIDADKSGLWNAGETYIPLNLGSSACATQPGGGALPYVNVPSKQNTCNGVWGGQNYVRRSAVIVLSGSDASIAPTTVTMPLPAVSCREDFPNLILTDVNGNAMPAGTTVSTSNNQVYYVPFGGVGSAKATVSITGGTPVIKTLNSGTPITLTVEADCTGGTIVTKPTGTVNVVVTTPKGTITTIPITVN
jgi:hypothetical protein